MFIWTFAEGFRRQADLAQLGCGQDASGHLDPHHECVPTLLLRVETDPLESLDLARHRHQRVDALGRVLGHDRLCDLEGVTIELEALDRVELIQIAIGADELELALRTARRHRIALVVEVMAHSWRPHSILSESAQRPARGSWPGSTGFVVGAQPIER